MASSFAQRESVLGELQIVRKIRETVRRWWGIELSFTDAKGFVVEHGKGILIPPSNRTCTACLGDRVGFQRCNESIEKAVKQFGSDPAPARLLGPCHMGLEIVAAPISYGGERQGSLFACGFVVAEKAEAARPHAVETTRRLQLPVIQPQEAFDTIARIDARDVPRLKDLIDTTVEEIAAYQNAVAERERNIQALRRELTGRYRFADIVGKSAPMQRLYALLDKLVGSDITVLVTGENGTGKELIARARQDRPLQGGRRRHLLPRRGGRHVARHAGEAPARPAGRDLRAGGRHQGRARRRAHHRRHQPGSARDGGAPPVP